MIENQEQNQEFENQPEQPEQDTPFVIKDDTESFSKEEIESGKGMAVLSYILAPIPYFAEKKNKFVQYHAKQGMNLLIWDILYIVIYNILTSVIKVNRTLYYGVQYKITPWWVTVPLNLISVVIGVLSIMGIVYAVQGKAKEIPFINKFKFFK